MTGLACETCGHRAVCVYLDHVPPTICGTSLPDWIERELVDAWSGVTQQRDSLQAEVARLRAIFPLVLAALRNGSKCSTVASVEFLATIPDEVMEEVNSLRDNMATNARLLARQCDMALAAETRAMAAEAEVARLREVMSTLVYWHDRDGIDESWWQEARAALEVKP